jgi:hypothetical protein
MLALIVWALARSIPSRSLRFHLRVVFLALGLGFIVIPGHGEIIAIPLLATLIPPVHPELLGIAGVYFFGWWVVILAIVVFFARRSLRARG